MAPPLLSLATSVSSARRLAVWQSSCFFSFLALSLATIVLAHLLTSFIPMEDPNLAQVPDYTASEFEEERQTFINTSLTAEQAAGVLTNLWTPKNNRDKDIWQRHQQAVAAAQEAARELADQRRAQQKEEDAQMLREKGKKNKIKFAPIPNKPVVSEPLVLPSLVAIRKIKNHQFCKLWYFTNAGLNEAERSASYSLDDNSLSIVPATDGSHSFVPSAFARDKADVVRDKNLSFEQFSQAPVQMVKSMIDCTWQQPHVDILYM